MKIVEPFVESVVADGRGQCVLVLRRRALERDLGRAEALLESALAASDPSAVRLAAIRVTRLRRGMRDFLAATA